MSKHKIGRMLAIFILICFGVSATLPASAAMSIPPWLDPPPVEEPEIDPLILQYEPILYFHQNENFYPMDVESFVEHSSLWQTVGPGVDVEIKAESAADPVTLVDLTSEGVDTSEYYLQFSADLANKTPDPEQSGVEYQALRSAGAAKYTYYGRRMEDSYTDADGATHNFVVLQYWYFYAFNDFGRQVPDGNNHEGDWECVMVFLDRDSLAPLYVAYSAHHNQGRLENPVTQFDSVRRGWDSTEVNKDGDQVLSFIGLGSHANYPNNGNNGTQDILLVEPVQGLVFASHDYTSVDGSHFYAGAWQSREVFDDADLPEWVSGYEGYWGVKYPDKSLYYQPGPVGPGQQDKFSHPVQWAGLDKIGQKTITEQLVTTVDFIESATTMVFDTALEVGTQIAVDLHQEVISFGENLSEIFLAPYFWDLSSSLVNNTFNTEVTFVFNPTDMRMMGTGDLGRLTVFVYDEDNQQWISVPSTVNLENSQITFSTTHFSRYAIGIKKIQWQEVTDQVKVVANKKSYNQRTGIQEINFRIVNNSATAITGPLLLSISDLDTGIEFVNADNLTDLMSVATGLPVNLQAVDFSDAYQHCLFTGTAADIPATVSKANKKRLITEKPMSDTRCAYLIARYPTLEPFLEDVLPIHRMTEAMTLRFKLPTKKDRKFDYQVQVWNEVQN